MRKTRVMVIDDSAVVRQTVSELLSSDPGIEVIGSAADPLFALERMKKEWPDVIVLDIEMPRMDGLTFLRKIMAERPTPVVICSTLTERGAATTVEALAAGAVSILTKPKVGLKQFFQDTPAELLTAVKTAANVNVSRLRSLARQPALSKPQACAPKLDADAVLDPAGPRSMQQTTERIVAIGTSTGGTQALEAVLTALPQVSPGIAIVQHMPEKFTAAFAQRLNNLCAIEVREARHGERLLPGHALVAPGGKHLLLRRSGAFYYAEVRDGPLINRHRPSVDVLFRSVAQCAGRNALGIIMTGMGDDGARGLKELRDAGGRTLAQDEATCVVYGMPKEAVRMGAVERSMALGALPSAIQSWN